MTCGADHRRLELRLLGPIEARVDDVPVMIAGPRRRALLVRLALSPNEVVSADRLIDDMWGANPPPSAARALQVHVSQLRHVLRAGEGASAKTDELIVTRPSGYMLQLGQGSLDTSRFEDFYVKARHALERHEYAEAGALCRAALCLWRGPALVGLSEDFAVAEVARLDDLRLAVIEMRIEADLAQAGHVEVIGELETLVARFPYREHLWWLLAVALYRSGRHAEALRACTRLREILREELGLDPSLEITKLEHQIIVQDPALEIDARAAAGDRTVDESARSGPPSVIVGRRTNVPRNPTAFIGGEGLLEEIGEQVGLGSVVTLTGTGGVGKTRAATEFCHRHLAEFPDGVFFVDFAPVSDRAAVVGALALTLPIAGIGDESVLGAILDWIADRRVLLVFDNCEHLVADVGVLAEELIDRCPNVQILATSREPLRVRGERVHRVPSLRIHGPAVELFCERASATDTSFTTNGHDDALAQICRRLDGIPLAIELAAARIRALSLDELLQRLEDRFRLLSRSDRGALERHQTLRATVTWSYQLLTEDERCLFDRLSVFSGGFDLSGAEAVCGFEPLERIDVIDLLSSLVDKSMIVADRGPLGMRYKLLETLRQYGDEQMAQRDEAPRLNERHARFFADLIGELDVLSRGARQVEAEARMSLEWDNLRAALLWAVAHGELDLAERLAESSFQYSVFSLRYEHADLLARTVQLGDEQSRPSTSILGMLSYWADLQGNREDAERLANRGLDAARTPQDPATANCWWTFSGASAGAEPHSASVLAAFQNQAVAVARTPQLDRNWWTVVCLTDAALNADLSAVGGLIEQLHELAAQVQSPRLALSARQHEGHALLEASPPDFAAAIRAYEQVAEIARATGDHHSIGIAQRCLAMAATGLDAPDALARCHDALYHLYEVRLWQKLWQTLESVSLALARAGRTEEAAVILGCLDVRSPGYGMEHGLGFRDQARQLIDADGGHDAAKRHGAAMSADELVAEALDYCSREACIKRARVRRDR
jgi:predicted ATPase/DNA-binding SARP family transcriptional activator